MIRYKHPDGTIRTDDECRHSGACMSLWSVEYCTLPAGHSGDHRMEWCNYEGEYCPHCNGKLK